MPERVCPVWMGWLLASPLRKLWQNPEKILRPFITPGMTVLEPGSAMGFFSLPAAKLVGPQGKVICVDLQPGMLSRLATRAARAGLGERLEPRLCSETSLNIDDLNGKTDFAFAIAVVHEVPDQDNFFQEMAAALKPGGKLLFAEPKGHVTREAFQQSLAWAQKWGLQKLEDSLAHGALTAVLKKS
jgi:ubiquinone/menaquinone biosynthesis C-methylase UbiE